jgi:DNA-directed RNA polymerase beta subunit
MQGSELILSNHLHYVNEETLECIPGLNLFAIFVNLELTYEDGMVLSRSAAARFKYSATVSVYLSPVTDTIPMLGDVVDPFSANWWQNHFHGTVAHKSAGPEGSVRVVLECQCLPVNGDKFTTLHGQKGVVTILDDAQMPSLRGQSADIVIGSSSIVKRETISQLLEAACGMYVHTHLCTAHSYYIDTVLSSYSTEFNLRGDVCSSILALFEDEIVISGHKPRRRVTSADGATVISKCVRANYGYIRVMQSCFLASCRMSCTSRSAGLYNLTPSSRSAHGGSKSLGEMECMQLVASGMSACVQEFVNRSNMCIVDVCRRCRLLLILCTCTSEQQRVVGVDQIKLPYTSVMSITASKVGFGANTRLNIR